MIFRASREPCGPDPRLTQKLYIFASGAALGLAGIATGRTLLVWIGIAVLAAGVLLRFRRSR